MKKSILAAGLAICIVLGLASCSGKGESANEAPKTPAEMTNIELIDAYGDVVDEASKNLDDTKKLNQLEKKAATLMDELKKRELSDNEESKLLEYEQKAMKAAANVYKKAADSFSSSDSDSSFSFDSDDDSDDKSDVDFGSDFGDDDPDDSDEI